MADVSPNNTSHEELWRYFNSTIPSSDPTVEAESWRGPSSIFLISRSSCAFVNLSSQTDLERAVSFFNGRPLRPWDPRCPRMVCRIRRKDDDLRAGVGAQRGTGMHRDWIKTQQIEPPGGGAAPLPQTPGTSKATSSVPPSPVIMEHAPDGEGRRRESIVVAPRAVHQTSDSYASTNSSFLLKHFPKRFFILKSWTTVSHHQLHPLTFRRNWRIAPDQEPGKPRGTTSRFLVSVSARNLAHGQTKHSGHLMKASFSSSAPTDPASFSGTPR